MNSKKILRNALILSLMILIEVLLVLIFIKILPVSNEINGIKIYPQKVSTRSLVSSENFSLVWSKETEDGNQHIVYTQLFSLEEQLLYVSENSLSALDYFTGELRWSIKIPESSKFQLYEDKLYSLAVYDNAVPFAPEININMPSDCNSPDLSTMHVYNPHDGRRIWEYSYHMVAPYRGISFKNNSAFIDGLTIAFSNKYHSELEVDIATGKVLNASCRNIKDYSYSNEGRTEGVLSSGFLPIYDDLGWKMDVDKSAFIVESTKLTMVNRENKQPMGFIEFSGSELNPFAVEMVVQGDLLVVYLDDSNQFFVFQMK